MWLIQYLIQEFIQHVGTCCIMWNGEGFSPNEQVQVKIKVFLHMFLVYKLLMNAYNSLVPYILNSLFTSRSHLSTFIKHCPG